MNWQLIDTAKFYNNMLFIASIFLICFTLAYPIVTRCSLGRIGILARTPFIGVPLAILATWWVIPHVAILLNYVDSPQDASQLLPYAIGACFICCLFLDFLASRALAAVMLLFCYTGVNGAYIYTSDSVAICAKCFSALALVFSIIAIAISAKPHLMRDMLYYLGHKAPKWLFYLGLLLLLLFAVSSTILYATTFYVK